MKKTFSIAFLLCCTILLFPIQAIFAQDISITYNGEPLQYIKQPISKDSYIYIPINGYLGALGYETTWDSSKKIITLKKNMTTIILYIDKKTALRNDMPITLDCPPTIVNDTVMLPLRFVAENAGAVVSWNEETQSVNLIMPKSEISQLTHSVVTIYTDHTQGSGIILSENGLIATNYHVVSNTTQARILFSNGVSYNGPIYLAGYDAPDDIVLLKIDQKGLSPVTLGRPSNELGIGTEVIAIGAPNGQMNTVSCGHIVETGNRIISSTAAIDVGSSGGALFDKSGNLLGMTSAFSRDGYFSIPCEIIAAVPHNLSLPLTEINNISIPILPPQNISHKIIGDKILVSWEPRVGVDYFSVYLSPTPDSDYSRIDNPLVDSDEWYWDFPYCYGMTTTHPGDLYIKVSSTRNGVESDLSAPLKLK